MRPGKTWVDLGRSGKVLAWVAVLSALGSIVRATADAEPLGRIERIELKTESSSTKVFIMLSRPLAFHVRVLDGETVRKSARRLVLDFDDATLAPETTSPITVEDGLVRQVRTGQPTSGTARVVLDLATDAAHSVEAYETPPHVTIALSGGATTGDSPPGPRR
jgi:N-acetylmuramoyl-L-alanine amidase